MSPEQLAERYRHVVRSNAGQLRDSGGDPSEQMISQLVGIAEEHAREVGVIAVKPEDDYKPEHAAPAPRRRAPARGRAK
jgi:hypothetical protein